MKVNSLLVAKPSILSLMKTLQPTISRRNLSKSSEVMRKSSSTNGPKLSDGHAAVWPVNREMKRQKINPLDVIIMALGLGSVLVIFASKISLSFPPYTSFSLLMSFTLSMPFSPPIP
jgi:hypothetical protein